MITPKFNVGDNVNLKIKTLFDETTGKVVEVEKLYTSPVTRLAYTEFDINTMSDKIDHKFENDILTIDYGDGLKTFTHTSFMYTIKTEKMRCLYREKNLSLI